MVIKKEIISGLFIANFLKLFIKTNINVEFKIIYILGFKQNIIQKVTW